MHVVETKTTVTLLEVLLMQIQLFLQIPRDMDHYDNHGVPGSHTYAKRLFYILKENSAAKQPRTKLMTIMSDIDSSLYLLHR